MSALITPLDIEALAPTSFLPYSPTASAPPSGPDSLSPSKDYRGVRSRRSSRTCVSPILGKDALMDAYYENFHKFHPLVLPCRHLVKFLDDPNWKPRLEPLLATMKMIGNLYLTQEWSTALQNDVEIRTEGLANTDPIRVQCHLLYSAALFWQDQKQKSQVVMGKAVEIALELKMFERDFALVYSGQDAVLAECWRRTWWMVYAFDAFYAGTLGKVEFSVARIDATADLPCEEAQYELGVRACRDSDQRSKSRRLTSPSRLSRNLYQYANGTAESLTKRRSHSLHLRTSSEL